MARNYTIGEAVEIIAAGKDAEAIQDLGRRYPLLVAKVANIVAGSNKEAVVEMFGYMPEYLSANKVNKMIKQNVLGEDSDSDAEDVDDAQEDAPKGKKEKKAEKAAKAEKADKKGGKKSNDPYAGKDAIELFKECKKRGIKAAPKKTAKFYADLLKKADAEAAEAEEAEDWDEDEEEEEEVTKPAKKEKKPAKKAKEEEPEDDDDEDDDDDWDI